MGRLVCTPCVGVRAEVTLVDEPERAKRAIRERVLESPNEDANGNQVRYGSIRPSLEWSRLVVLPGCLRGRSVICRCLTRTLCRPLIGQEQVEIGAALRATLFRARKREGRRGRQREWR